MATAFAVYRIDTERDELVLRVVHIFWREEEAIEMTDRLNALATRGPGRTKWMPVWVAAPPPAKNVVLTPHDRELLDLIRAHDALDTERPIAVFFTFLFNPDGLVAACDALREFGWPEVGSDEEVTGDECYHVYAHDRRLVVNEDSILQLRTDMEALADGLGGRFDAWDVSGGAGLRHYKPGQLPT